jgi:hypothetical protein
MRSGLATLRIGMKGEARITGQAHLSPRQPVLPTAMAWILRVSVGR